MARGKSGRVVLEIDPTVKRNLYLALEKNQKTLKEWFIQNAEEYIYSHQQLTLFVAENKPQYKSRDNE